jgi:hypothetical protein
LSCDLHSIQEDTFIDGRAIEDNAPPKITTLLPSPDGAYVFVGAQSPYAQLSAFRMTVADRTCERIGDLGLKPEEAKFVSNDGRMIARLADGTTVLVDMRQGITIARESMWADHIAAVPSLKTTFFSKGALLRNLSLDPSRAIARLCDGLQDKELSESEWLVRFGSEERWPSCVKRYSWAERISRQLRSQILRAGRWLEGLWS